MEHGNLDQTDKRIADLLMEDGRMSSSDIARALGDVSERSVRYRLERLIQEGILTVNAVVHPEKLGYEVVGDVFLEVEPGAVLEIARLIAKFDNVSYVACSTGESGISVQVVARSNAALYQFVTEVLGKITGVRRSTTKIVPFKLKDVYQWKVPSEVIDDRKRNA